MSPSSLRFTLFALGVLVCASGPNPPIRGCAGRATGLGCARGARHSTPRLVKNSPASMAPRTTAALRQLPTRAALLGHASA